MLPIWPKWAHTDQVRCECGNEKSLHTITLSKTLHQIQILLGINKLESSNVLVPLKNHSQRRFHMLRRQLGMWEMLEKWEVPNLVAIFEVNTWETLFNRAPLLSLITKWERASSLNLVKSVKKKHLSTSCYLHKTNILLCKGLKSTSIMTNMTNKFKNKNLWLTMLCTILQYIYH